MAIRVREPSTGRKGCRFRGGKRRRRGPKRMPRKMRGRVSGIRVFLNRRSERTPTAMIRLKVASRVRGSNPSSSPGHVM